MKWNIYQSFQENENIFDTVEMVRGITSILLTIQRNKFCLLTGW